MKVKLQRVVILSIGFAAFSLIKKMNTDIYDVIVVSPSQNYFETVSPARAGTDGRHSLFGRARKDTKKILS